MALTLQEFFEKTLKFNWTSTDDLTDYDIHSIMHYDGTLRGHFSYPVMTDKRTGKGIEINRKMSSLDIQKLNKMYPCQSTGPACGKFYSIVTIGWAFIFRSIFDLLKFSLL